MMKTFMFFANHNYLFIGILTIFLISCKSKADLAQNQSIAEAKWSEEQILRFEYYCEDTLNYKDIFFILRHSGHYPYANLFLFVTIKAPNGTTTQDTLEYLLADIKGKWYGKGIGDIRSLQLAYKRNIRFGQQGRYIFYIKHGMREKILNGITDLGMLIKNIDLNE